MNKFRRTCFALFSLVFVFLLSGCSKMLILDPKGPVAAGEKNMLITAVLLMLIVVIPVIILTFVISRKYRASNTKAKYAPNWGHSTMLEMVWWAIPFIIIIVLAALTLVTTRELDPYRPLDVKGKPITIQVVALDWRWLFIYPEQHIATINFVQFPVNTQVSFVITADAPMNSLQIPQLAGQIYAMPGMQTKLHILSNAVGDYYGFSANFSGQGFSGMNFTARVSTQEEFNNWVNSVKQSHNQLTMAEYNKLSKASEDSRVQYFASVDNNIFKNVIMKFMMPMTTQGK